MALLRLSGATGNALYSEGMRRVVAVLAWMVACLLVLGSLGLGLVLLVSRAWIVAGFVLSVITVALGLAAITGFCGRRLWRQPTP